jgi:hypothetical protein
MIDSERLKLLYGPYVPPKCRLGDKLLCEYRDREVTVGGITDGRIPWPYARGPGRQGPILCGSLILAVRSESEIAVAYHWGVCTTTVKKWRRALEVPAVTNGTRSLFIGYGFERLVTPENKAKSKEAMGSEEVRAKIRASCIGRKLPPKTAAALLEAAKRPKSEEWKRGQSARSRTMWDNPEEHGLPAQHPWSDEDIALLGTKSDKEVGKVLGLPEHVVVYKRRSLGIEANVLEPWKDDEIALLGTDIDSEVARRLGRSLLSVRTKRFRLGIPPSTTCWTDEEIALLGSDTDREIARRLGKHERTIRKKRKELGIAPSLTRWTEKELYWLGRDTDWAIAKALGRSERAVAAQRSLRGIPAYREPGD